MISAPKPALATLMKYWSFICPTSIFVGLPVHASSSALIKSFASMPAPFAKSLAVPSGRIPSDVSKAFISPDHGIYHGVQGTVAAPGHYPLGSVLNGLPDEPSQVLPAPRNININVDARLSDMFTAALTSGLVQDFLCRTRQVLAGFFKTGSSFTRAAWSCLYVGVSYSPISSEFEQSSRPNAL